MRESRELIVIQWGGGGCGTVQPLAIGFYRELATCCTCKGCSRMNAAASTGIDIAHLLHELQINIDVQRISFRNYCATNIGG